MLLFKKDTTLKLWLLANLIFFNKLILGADIDSSQYCVGDYPLVFGSKTNTTGDTEFTAMDVDANGNIVLAGYSKDINLQPSAGRAAWPIIVLYDALNVLKWIKQSSVQETATDVVFSADYQRIIATLEGFKGDMYLAITFLQASDGTAIFTKYIQQPTQPILSLAAKTPVNSMITLKQSERIVIGFTYQDTTSNKVAFGIFDPSSDTFVVKKNTYYIQAQALTLVADELITNSQFFHFISYVTNPTDNTTLNYLICYDVNSNEFQDTSKIQLYQPEIQYSSIVTHSIGLQQYLYFCGYRYDSVYLGQLNLNVNSTTNKRSYGNYQFWSNLYHYNNQLLNVFTDTAIVGSKFFFIGSSKQFGISPSQLYSYTFKIGLIGEYDEANQYSLFDSQLTLITKNYTIFYYPYSGLSNGSDDSALFLSEIWNLAQVNEINSSIQISNLIVKPIPPGTSWILTKESWYINRISSNSGNYSLPVTLNVTCKDDSQPSFTLTYNYTTNQNGFKYIEDTKKFYFNISLIPNDIIILVTLEQNQQPPQYLKIFVQSSKNCTSATMSFNQTSMNFSSYLISDPLVIYNLPRATSSNKPECEIVYSPYLQNNTLGLEQNLDSSTSPIAYNVNNHQIFIYSQDIRHKGNQRIRLKAVLKDNSFGISMYINIAFNSLCQQDGTFLNVPLQNETQNISLAYSSIPYVRLLATQNWTYYNDSTQQYCPEVSYQLYMNGEYLRSHQYFNMIKIIGKDVILNISDISMCRSKPYYIKMLGYVGVLQRKINFYFNCTNDCVIQSQPDFPDIVYAIKKDGLQYYAYPKWEKNNAIYCTLEYRYDIAYSREYQSDLDYY
eukprot:403356873